MWKPISILKFVVLLCMVIVGGCATNPTETPLTPVDSELSSLIAAAKAHGDSEQLVALDMVGVLIQIREMDPEKVILKVDDLSSSFAANVQSALNSAGYFEQSEDRSLQPLSVVATVNPSSALMPVASTVSEASVKTYQIRIRNIVLRRDYLIGSGRIEPRSWMHIKGASAIRVRLDDSIFDTPSIPHSEPEQDSTFRPVQAASLALEAPRPAISTPAGADAQPPDAWSALELATPLVVRAESEEGAGLSVGDPMRITVEAGKDLRIHCYYEDGAGTVARLFPNRYRKDSLVRAGEVLVLPESNRWQLTAPPVGDTEHVMCIAIAPEGNDTKPLLPDLLPIVAADLSQIQKRYEVTQGAELVNSKISIAIN